jgi:hypothetical protein
MSELEIYQEVTYEVFDPENDRLVAVFTTQAEAEEFARWRSRA